VTTWDLALLISAAAAVVIRTTKPTTVRKAKWVAVPRCRRAGPAPAKNSGHNKISSTKASTVRREPRPDVGRSRWVFGLAVKAALKIAMGA